MNFVAMTEEEWQEVYQRHDELVRKAALELQIERTGDQHPSAGQQHMIQPLELQLRELGQAVASIRH